MTQASLAHTLGFDSHAHITNIEAGRRSPSLDFLLRVADYFRLPIDALVDDNVPVETMVEDELPRLALHQFGAKLRALRLQRRMTQGELAKAMNLDSHAHIANIETGRRVPSLDVVLRSAVLFNVSFEYLLRDTAHHQNTNLDT
ncbi:MAG: transcriptional regulator [Chloroflexota bacterium]|nr:transcriptional regulator [Chloroflexota bacterium]PLS82269.1 MAG: hypothetical protein CYG59_04615 [Chloroflexota bacterium]